MNKKKFLIFIGFVLVLSGCSNKVVEMAKETEEANQAEVEKKEQEQIALENEKKEIYKEIERPLDEVIQENELEEMEVIKNGDHQVQKKGEYSDENEFARYVAKTLFDYQASKLDPETYYNFLMEYGSEKIISDIPDDKEQAILVYENIQSLYKQNNSTPQSYVISKVGLSSNNREGYFYRQITTDKEVEYYITTIINKDGVWKFSEDSPSPPFDIKESLGEGE